MEKQEKLRLTALREAMRRNGIDCAVINSTDPHQSEIAPAHWRGREWLTGFKSENGTNGTAVVTQDKAYVWTDNRFFIQARQQLDGTGFEMMPLDGPDAVDMTGWIRSHLQPEQTVAIDGMTNSVTETISLKDALGSKGIRLRADLDLLDEIWTDRPSRPLNELFVHDETLTGENTGNKIARVLEAAAKTTANAVLLPALDDIAWITNLRTSGDITFSPVFVAYLYLDTTGKRVLFTDGCKISADARAHLDKYGIATADYDTVTDFVSRLPKAPACSSTPI